MHHKIMDWASKELYKNLLTADDSVKFHLLKDLSHVTNNEITCQPLILIDTAGANLFESAESDGVHITLLSVKF